MLRSQIKKTSGTKDIVLALSVITRMGSKVLSCPWNLRVTSQYQRWRDFQELYRYLIDDFIIQYCRKLRKKDLVLKTEYASNKRKSKREYLSDSLTKEFIEKLNRYFLTIVEVPRIMRGEKQEIETLINEEALLFAKFLRDEIPIWKPRILKLSN